MLRRDDTTLVVVDVQEGFRKVIPDFDAVAHKAATLVEGARILGVPVIVTEQYPKGLGSTAGEVGLDGEPVIEKTVFAASRADGFDLDGRKQAVVCGIEAHICVHQTVDDLATKGVEVHLATDAIASREPDNKAPRARARGRGRREGHERRDGAVRAARRRRQRRVQAVQRLIK
jgi:nicotinamidase-related amidase